MGTPIKLIWHRMLYSCTHMATVDVKGFGVFRCNI